MFFLRIKKGIPLKVLNELTNEVLEIHVPNNYKNTGMIVGLTLPKSYKILHTKQVVEKKDVNEDTDSNFNR
jgi:hypothetical protein